MINPCVLVRETHSELEMCDLVDPVICRWRKHRQGLAGAGVRILDRKVSPSVGKRSGERGGRS
jgi:hypothetical protein